MQTILKNAKVTVSVKYLLNVIIMRMMMMMTPCHEHLL